METILLTLRVANPRTEKSDNIYVKVEGVPGSYRTNANLPTTVARDAQPGDSIVVEVQHAGQTLGDERLQVNQSAIVQAVVTCEGDTLRASVYQENTSDRVEIELTVSHILGGDKPDEVSADPELEPLTALFGQIKALPYSAFATLLSAEDFEQIHLLGKAFHDKQRIDRLQYALCELCASRIGQQSAETSAGEWHSMRRAALLKDVDSLTAPEVEAIARLAELEERSRERKDRIRQLVEAVQNCTQEVFAHAELDEDATAELASFHREFCQISRFSEVMAQASIDPNTASDIAGYLFQGGGSDLDASTRATSCQWLIRTLHELSARVRDELRTAFKAMGYRPIVPRVGVDRFSPSQHEDLDPRDIKERAGHEGEIYQCIRFGVTHNDEVISKALVLRYQDSDREETPAEAAPAFTESADDDFVEGSAQ